MKQRDHNSIREIHYKLAKCLELIDEAIPRCPNAQVCALAVVIDDDLSSLLDECEGLLIGAKNARQKDVCSFEVRALTILEEAQRLLAEYAVGPAPFEIPPNELSMSLGKAERAAI